MKRYFDLDKKELAILGEEEISILLDLEIAEAGIMPIEYPTPPTLETEGIIRDDMAYEIKGIIVKTQEEALQICKMRIFREQYSYNCGYDYKWLDPVPELQPIQKAYYKQEDINRIKKTLQDNKRKKEDYEGKKKIYDNFLEKTGKIRNDVWNSINEAKEYYREIELAKKTFNKHMELSGGDKQIAERFFRNTYKDREDLINEILTEAKEM